MKIRKQIYIEKDQYKEIKKSAIDEDLSMADFIWKCFKIYKKEKKGF